jgi:hypothetical protein
MKNYTNTITKRIEAKAKATGFDKLSYFNMPDATHRNPWCTDEKTGLTHILLQTLKINTVDTDSYDEHKMGLNYWKDDLSHNTKRKGKFGYVTTTASKGDNGKYKNIRQMKVITNTTGLGRKVQVDHLNGDTYDDRKINLSVGTQQANLKNQYPYKEIPPIVYPWDHE